MFCQERTICVKISFLIKFQASNLTLYQKKLRRRCFLETPENFRNTFLIELVRVIVSNCPFSRKFLVFSWNLKKQILFQRGFYLLCLCLFRNSILTLRPRNTYIYVFRAFFVFFSFLSVEWSSSFHPTLNFQ